MEWFKTVQTILWARNMQPIEALGCAVRAAADDVEGALEAAVRRELGGLVFRGLVRLGDGRVLRLPGADLGAEVLLALALLLEGLALGRGVLLVRFQ